MSENRGTLLTATIITLVNVALMVGFVVKGSRGEPQPEQVIHVFTHTIDDREVRCIHFSQYGLSCDWTYGDRLGVNP